MKIVFTAVFLTTIFLLVLISAQKIYAGNLLTNFDFESWDQGNLLSWEKYGSPFSVSQANESGQFRSGSKSGMLKVTAENNSNRWIYQTIPVLGSKTYRFSGYIRGLSGNFNALLRIAWYAEGSTSQMSPTVDSESISNINEDFFNLVVEKTSPENARTAKVRIVITPTGGSTNNSILVDDFLFEEVILIPTPTPTPTPEIKSVEIKISLDSKKYLDEKFTVKAEAKNLAKDTEFYVKIRGGLEDSKLTKARTQNGESWLSDGESWSSFPIIKTNSDGNWSGEIYGMVDGEKETGNYKFRVRFRNVGTESNYDSEIKEMEIIKPAPTVTPIITPTPTPKPTIVATKAAEVVTEKVLGTESGQIKETAIKKNDPPILAAGLILIGLSLILGSVVKYPHGIKIGGSNS